MQTSTKMHLSAHFSQYLLVIGLSCFINPCRIYNSVRLCKLIKISLLLFWDLVAKNVDIMRDHILSVNSLLFRALINFLDLGWLVSKFCLSVEFLFDLGAWPIQGGWIIPYSCEIWSLYKYFLIVGRQDATRHYVIYSHIGILSYNPWEHKYLRLIDLKCTKRGKFSNSSKQIFFSWFLSRGIR